MFGNGPSKLDGEMLPVSFGFLQKWQHVIWNLCIFQKLFLLSSPVENQLSPVNLFFIYIYISSLQSFNLVLIPCVKFDGYRGTWTGYINIYETFIFLPKQVIKFLGFDINSQKWKQLLLIQKLWKDTLKACFSELPHKNNQTIRYVAKVIGLMTSSLLGVKYRGAHYKYLGQDKINVLKISTGCFDAILILSPQSLTGVQW